jgi:hypothetical protein
MVVELSGDVERCSPQIRSRELAVVQSAAAELAPARALFMNCVRKSLVPANAFGPSLALDEG